VAVAGTTTQTLVICGLVFRMLHSGREKKKAQPA